MGMFKEFNECQEILTEGMFNKYSTSASGKILNSEKFTAQKPTPRPVLTREGIKLFLKENNIYYIDKDLDEFIELAKFEDSEYGKDEIGEIEFYHNIHAHYVYTDDHNTHIINSICTLNNTEQCMESRRAALKRCVDRVVSTVEVAERLNIQVLVDAEQSYIQRTLDSLTRQLQTKHHKDKKAFILNGYQSYLKSSPEHVRLEIERCKRAGLGFGIKLVRGAYMGEERRLAQEFNYESPIWDTIEDTHKCYNQNLQNIIQNIDKEKGNFYLEIN